MSIDPAPQTPLVDAVRRTHTGTSLEFPELSPDQREQASQRSLTRASTRGRRHGATSVWRTLHIVLLAAFVLVVGFWLSVGDGMRTILRRANSAASELAMTNSTAADALNLLGFNAVRSATGRGPICDVRHPTFLYGFAALKLQIGARMGDPLECEHAIYPTGDTHQLTSTGLAYYRSDVNIPSFVSGQDHWALTKRGLEHWIGDVVDPPGTAQPDNQPN